MICERIPIENLSATYILLPLLDCSKAKKKKDWTNTRGAMGHFITPGFVSTSESMEKLRLSNYKN